ncbi:hypothetical protein EV651_12023 [Kribbella sp. VKM Ac-2571]|uniref:hypothetical protein n=1 Tax=Kribbella sp. VKM Ac-2571 TaxID=2512222 RepID=UPI00105DE7BE|nr:hypothetical protein [Kribbella sp. VKM Ac-2571]TDO50339.1 hypothetical protein EV651_12023 [Kribbella sp. VKM Ac-2571]
MRRVLKVVVVLLLLVIVPLGAYAISLRVQYTGDPTARTRGQDALWLGHAWVDGRKSAADVTALAQRLQGTGIRDLYVHAGPLEHDGSLPLAKVSPKARWFVDAMHAAAPAVRVQAWLGDVVQPGKDPGMNLDDSAVRRRVVESASAVLQQGFQGIHYDFEPVRSGSKGYLSVLDETRALGTTLSVAAAQIDPLWYLHVIPVDKWWSQDYFRQVAERVNQVAVMSYDTALPLESLYGGYVAKQTKLALEVIPPATDLLMGLPAYWENNPSHWGNAETVSAAVRGARLGLGDSPRQNFGLALYVDFAATDEHWTAYRDGWCVAP